MPIVNFLLMPCQWLKVRRRASEFSMEKLLCTTCRYFLTALSIWIMATNRFMMILFLPLPIMLSSYIYIYIFLFCCPDVMHKVLICYVGDQIFYMWHQYVEMHQPPPALLD